MWLPGVSMADLRELEHQTSRIDAALRAHGYARGSMSERVAEALTDLSVAQRKLSEMAR